MSTEIILKKSAISGRIPTTAQLEFGELAVNTYDGKIYFKINDGTERIISVEPGAVTSSSSTPSNAVEGQLWYDTSDSSFYVYNNGEWVSLITGGDSTTNVEISSTAPTSPSAGDLWFDDTDSTINIYYDDGSSAAWVALNDFDTTVDLSTSTTDDLAEGSSNLYHTNARVDARISAASISDLSDVDLGSGGPSDGQSLVYDSVSGAFLPGAAGTVDLSSSDTDSLSEGSSNLYFTDARARNAISVTGDLTYDIPTGQLSVTTYKTSDFDTDFATKTTDDLSEGTSNLYFADSLARNAISVTGDLSYNISTGVIDFSESVNSVNSQTGAVNLDTDDILEGTSNLYYTDARVQTKLGNVSGNIIPDTNEAYDLGSATNRFRDIFLSGNTINLGGSSITASGEGAIVLPAGSQIGTSTLLSEGSSTDNLPEGTSNLYYTDARVGSYLSTNTFATQTYVDDAISTVIDSAPAALDTLNELAAALGDDANFSTTISTSLGNRLRIDTNSQGLTATEKSNAVTNLGLATVATSGAYSDLTGTPTNVSTFTNDSGYITDYTVTESDVTAHQAALAINKSQVTDLTTSDLDLGTNKILFSNVYNNLDDLPTASDYHGMFAHVHATGKAYYAHAGSWVELANASGSFDGDYNSLSNTPTIPADVSDLTDTTTLLFDGDYNSLTNAPTIPSALTDLSITDGTDGQVLSTDGAGNFTFIDAATDSGGSSVTTSDTAPSSPSEGDLWFDTDDGSLNIYYTDVDSSQWIALNDFDSIVPTRVSSTAPSAAVNGDLWFDTDDGSLNIYYNDGNTSQWVALNDFSTLLTQSDSDDITEGSTNLYYTDARVASYLTTNSYATESYVDSAVSDLIDTAPGALDTLNELAAAIGDDANFSTTITNSIATKLSDITNESIGDLSDVTITSPSSGQVIKYNGTAWVNDIDSGGIALTDLSITTNAVGTAALSYDNATGVFTYTPPDLSSYLTSYTVTESDVTAHEAALSITESQITDLGSYISLGDLSVTNATASGDGALAYNIATGVFTFTPPDLSSKIELGDISVTQNAASGDGALAYNIATGVLSYTPPDLSNFVTAENSGSSVTASDTAPSSPAEGDLWYDTTALNLYVYYSDNWIQTNGSSSTSVDLSSIDQSILPDTDVAYDLGSPTKQWRDVYVGPGSLYVNGTKVLEDDNGTINVTADENQSIRVGTTGTGQTTIDSAAGVNITSTGSADITLTTATGQIEVNGDVVIDVTKAITSSNGSAITFNAPINAGTNTITAQTFAGNYTGTITESQISDLQSYLTDYTVTESDVTSHQAALSITESQISDLQSYLTSETTTSLAINANVLTYTDETGTDTDIDLSLYLDDSNLARLVSGTVDASTGIATFTRDDATTFTVDFSAFLDDTNLTRIDSATFNTADGVLTLTRGGDSTTVTVDLDGRFALSTDLPTAVSELTNDSGYLTTVAFSDLTTVPTTLAGYGITDAATSAQGTLADSAVQPSDNISVLTNDSGFITDYTVTESDVTAHQAALSITKSQVSDLATSDLDLGTNKILYSNVYSTLDDLPSAASYHGMFAHVHGTGKAYYAHAGSWVELASASGVFDGDYNSLTNTPTLFDGDYNSLTNTPTLFDGDYSSLTNTPTIPAALTDLSITDGTSGQILSTDGAGNFTFIDAASGGGTSVTVSDTAPSNASSGELWFDSTDGSFHVYYDDYWIALNDNNLNLLSGNSTFTVDTFTGDNTTTAFTLTETPSSANDLIVTVDGIIQRPTTDYTVSGTTLTFVTAPYNGGVIASRVISGLVYNATTNWEEVTSSITAEAGDKLLVDCSSSAVTVTLPASPSMGDEVRVIDAEGNAATNNITIDRNGNNISGLSENLVININEAAFGLVYYNATRGWVLTEK